MRLYLGDKWPAIDFYVELTGVPNRRFYFFVQVKSTRAALKFGSDDLKISSDVEDVRRLLQIPGPTYIFGVHEPSKRVFVRSVHADTKLKAISRIPKSHELTSDNLRRLYNEVRDYWLTADHKPNASVFA